MRTSRSARLLSKGMRKSYMKAKTPALCLCKRSSRFLGGGALANDANIEHYINLGARFFLTGWAAWVAAGGNAFKARVDAAASA